MSVSKLFRELKVEALKVSIFKSFLNAAIFFLLLDIVFIIFRVQIIYAFVLSLIFLAINTYLAYASITLKAVEDANPEVREMLRTAKDTMDQDNVMIRALQKEVLGKARKIYTGNLLDYRHLSFKVISIGFLVVASIFTSSIVFDMDDIRIPYDKLRFRGGLTSYGIDNPVELEGGRLQEDDSIYGDASVAKLGNEVLDLNLNPSSSELDLDQLKEAEGVALGRMSYPVDVEAQGAEASLAKKPQESELVNAFYMKKNAR